MFDEAPRKISDYIGDCRSVIQQKKPNDRSEADRVFAILITDLEKAIALAKMHDIQGAER